MDDVFILNEDVTDAARSGLLRLHDAVGRREAGRPEAELSPEELLARFRAADPTRNGACLPWLLRTYASEGYRVEDLSKVHDTLAAFARLRGQLPNTSIIDGETRNPRKLGSHMTLASLWTVIEPLIEAKRLAQEDEADEKVDSGKELALSQSRVIHRSNRMVVAVPMTVEASCWWGQGTQWCTAARNNSAFEHYYKKAPLIVVCLRKNGDLPARKLQLHVHSRDMQFMDENDAPVSLELIIKRWQDLEALLYWAVGRNGEALAYMPVSLRTEAICLTAVEQNGRALVYVPNPLRTEEICTAAVEQNGQALAYVPKPLCTEEMCLAAVESDGLALPFVPEPLRTEAICTAAVGRNGRALAYVPELLRTEAICTVAASRDGLALQDVPEPLRTKAICTTAVEQDGMALRYVPKLLRTEEICTTAIEQNEWAIEFVPSLLYTKAMWLCAVGRDGQLLSHVPSSLCTEAVCLTAVTQDGRAVQFIPPPLRTEAICLAAVNQNGWTLYCVPELLRTEAVCTAAVGRNGEALEYVPEPLRKEVMRLVAVAKDEQKSVSINSETNERKSYDLVLEGLEDYLNNSQPSQQNTSSVTKLAIYQ